MLRLGSVGLVERAGSLKETRGEGDESMSRVAPDGRMPDIGLRAKDYDRDGRRRDVISAKGCSGAEVGLGRHNGALEATPIEIDDGFTLAMSLIP